MSSWRIETTKTFLKHLKKHKSNHELFRELEKVIQRLKFDPVLIGGHLSGKLHGKQSTRLVGKFRLVFQVDEKTHIVYLVDVDPRGRVYD